MSWEALAAGQQIAAQTQSAADGRGRRRRSRRSCRRIWRANRWPALSPCAMPLLDEYTADGFAAAFEQLIQPLDPSLVLFPHTYQVRDFAPRLAARFGQTLIADVIAIGHGGRPARVRAPVAAGQTECRLSSTPARVPASPPSRRAPSAPTRWRRVACAVEEFVPPLEASQIRSQPGERFRESAQTVDLSAAQPDRLRRPRHQRAGQYPDRRGTGARAGRRTGRLAAHLR